MNTPNSTTQHLVSRVEALTNLLKHLEEELQSLLRDREIAPPCCSITRYQARGKTKNYWYYKWQSSERVFPTAFGKKTRYKHLGKAGSQAYLAAVTAEVHRATYSGLQQAISTLKKGLQDLFDESKKNQTE